MGWYEVVLEIVFFFVSFSLEYCTNWGVQADTCGTRVLTSSEVDSWRDAECWFFGKRERGETRRGNDIWCRYCRTGPEDRGGHSY